MSPKQLEQIGELGRQYVVKHHNIKHLAERYSELFA